jgi:cytochrome oxidase Cu insertion factor (SCO1/SenC/PrrC family)
MFRLLVICLLLFPRFSLAQDPNAFVRQMAGKPFPAFALKSHQGRQWTEQNLRGKVTLVSFWFIGCKGCMQEIPGLNMIQDSVRDPQFQLISFARNTPKEIETFVNKRYDTTARAFKNYRSARQMNYEIIPSCLPDPRPSGNNVCELLHRKLHVNTYPVTMLVDKKGVIRHVLIGFPDPVVPTKDGILKDPGIRKWFYGMTGEIGKLLEQ